jgi:hypothetical protein
MLTISALAWHIGHDGLLELLLQAWGLAGQQSMHPVGARAAVSSECVAPGCACLRQCVLSRDQDCALHGIEASLIRLAVPLLQHLPCKHGQHLRQAMAYTFPGYDTPLPAHNESHLQYREASAYQAMVQALTCVR